MCTYACVIIVKYRYPKLPHNSTFFALAREEAYCRKHHRDFVCTERERNFRSHARISFPLFPRECARLFSHSSEKSFFFLTLLRQSRSPPNSCPCSLTDAADSGAAAAAAAGGSAEDKRSS